MMNDAEAIKLALHGREEGFRAIFANHSAFLFTHALRILKDRLHAEDAVQETFSAAFRALGSFRGEARLRTWLYQILYRNAIRLAGRNQRTLPLVAEPPDKAGDFPDLEQKSDVESILDQLGERDRAILIMTYWDEMPLSEAAEVLEVCENNAKIILFRARKRFAGLWSAANRGKDGEQHEL